MQRATPVQMRQSLELSMTLKNAGLRFVPIPVVNEAEFVELMQLLSAKLSGIEQDLTKSEYDGEDTRL